MNFLPEEEFGRKPKKKLSLKEARLKAASFCAYQERYQQEVRDKLYSFGLTSEHVEELLSDLISEGFVNEERFAKVFAGGRFRLKKWGKTRIRNELMRRRISEYCINNALNEITDGEYLDTIKSLVEKKDSQLQEEKPFVRKRRIARYLVGKGFETSLVWDVINDKFST